MTALRAYAHALGGVVSGGQVLFPGPHHSPSARWSDAGKEVLFVTTRFPDDLDDVLTGRKAVA